MGPEISNFLNKLSTVSHENYKIVRSLREMVFDFQPDVSERIKYGGIMFEFKNSEVGGLFAYKDHVSFEFGAGYRFADPECLLMGQGKYRRHLKFRSISEAEDLRVKFFIGQMFECNA